VVERFNQLLSLLTGRKQNNNKKKKGKIRRIEHEIMNDSHDNNASSNATKG